MRTHAAIVNAIGPMKVSDRYQLSIHTVRSWVSRDKIPDEYWADFAKRDEATLEELAEYAATKKAA